MSPEFELLKLEELTTEDMILGLLGTASVLDVFSELVLDVHDLYIPRVRRRFPKLFPYRRRSHVHGDTAPLSQASQQGAPGRTNTFPWF